MTRSILVSALALAALTGCERPRSSDHPEIAAHYGFRHKGVCQSWLHSFKTGYAYCASPALAVKVEVPTAPVEKPKDGPVTKEALVERGELVYGQICIACHQENGQGVAGTYPPLAGAGSFYGDARNQANIIVNGLNGPINVLGNDFNGAMPAQAQLSDYEVAAVATYVRNSWGNDDGIVTPDDVKSVRK
ncbi:MAG: cytochrome c [Myxococcota bacterium]